MMIFERGFEMYKTKRRYQGEPIRTDPTVDPKENETAIHFNAGDRSAWISSYESDVIAGLLTHPDFKIEELVLMRLERQDSVVGVVGRIPLAALRIGPSRQTGAHDQIIPLIRRERLSVNDKSSVKMARSHRRDRSAPKPKDRGRKAAAKASPKSKLAKVVLRRKRVLPKKKSPSNRQLPLALHSRAQTKRAVKGRRLRQRWQSTPNSARRATRHRP
jgi:hypothetical protein